MSRLYVTSVVMLTLASAATAHAQVSVTTLDGRSWSEVVAELTADLGSEGVAIPLCAHEAGSPACARCDRYRLSLEGDAAAAFRLEACDPTTHLTTARLLDRSALFDHSGAIPVPRAMSLSVAMVGRSGVVTARPQVGGSAESCSVRVHPFVRDLEHGETVYLDPSEYAVRVAASSIHVDATDEGGFVLWSTDRAQTEVSYDVVERATGAIVVVGHASLDCTSAIDVPAVAVPVIAPAPLPRPELGRSLRVPVHAGAVRITDGNEHLDASRIVAIAGLSLTAASAITLLVEGVADALEIAPVCLDSTAAPSVTAYGAPAPASTSCARSTGPRPSHVPAELSYAALGGLGIGALLGTVGLILMNTLPNEQAPQLSLDLGPNGGSISATFRF